MSYFAETMVGKQIDCVLADSEVTYIMLSDGTQITIRGLVVIQPSSCDRASGKIPAWKPAARIAEH